MACGNDASHSDAVDACGGIACVSSDGAVAGDVATTRDAAHGWDDAMDGTLASDVLDGDVFDAAIDADAGCSDLSACDDRNACTRDDCVDGACVHSPVPDGTSCDDGQLCTVADTCQSGVCSGTPRTSAASVVATAYAFGGVYVAPDFESSRGGLVAFVSAERLLFADRLDSDATVLTLADVTAGTLSVVAQTVTDSLLQTGELNGWVWQPVPISHLVALPNDRFALFSAERIQVFQEAGGQLSEIWRVTTTPEQVYDAVWAGDSIWSCRGSEIIRYALQADGSLVETPAPELAVYAGCIRMAVAPDEITVYASDPLSASPGVFRWAATAGTVTSDVVLPGIVPLDMAVDDTHLALQRVGQEGDFGDTEVYRLSDNTRIAVFSQTATSIPFALALSSGNLFLEWTRSDATSERVTGAVYGLATDTAIALDEWTVRTRISSATDRWATFEERIPASGSHVVLGPWRHVATIDPASGLPTWVTGPGHGEIVGIQRTGSTVAATFSPYSVEQVDVSSGIRFSGGGMDLPLDTHGLQVVLPDEDAPPSSFVATPEPDEQRAETEPVTVLRVNASAGLEVAGEFSLDGGPAKLVHRGNKLYQVAAVGATDYRIRVFTIAPNILGQTPLAPDAEYTMTVSGVPSDLKRTSSYTFYQPDVDPDRGQIAITEIWESTDGGPAQNSVVWAALSGTTATMIARASLDSGATPLLREGQLMIFDAAHATFYAPDGTGGLAALAQASCESFCQVPLGVDSANRVYVTSNSGRDVLVLSMADASVLARLPLPDAVRNAAAVGDRLLLGATHSITMIEPACGEPAADAGDTDGAGGDGSAEASTPDAASACGEVANCPEDGLPASTLLGDVNGDGCVDAADVAAVALCVGRPIGDVCSMSFVADVDHNGLVDVRDYLKVAGRQGQGCDAGP